jgi:hypothetical protein
VAQQRAVEFRDQCAQWVAQARAAGKREVAVLAGKVDIALADAMRAAARSAVAQRKVKAGAETLLTLQAAAAQMVPRGEAEAARREAAESAREAERLAAMAARQAEESGALAARLQAGQEEVEKLRSAIQVGRQRERTKREKRVSHPG